MIFLKDTQKDLKSDNQNIENSMIFQGKLKEICDKVYDAEEEKMDAATKLGFKINQCDNLISYCNLFHNNIFFSGVILDIEEISETEDVGNERIKNITALKFRVYYQKFYDVGSLVVSITDTTIYLYLDDMDSVDILQEFEVGDFVGFIGHVKNDLRLLDFYNEDDALDESMSPSNICWTSAFMMHKHFLDVLGIDELE